MSISSSESIDLLRQNERGFHALRRLQLAPELGVCCSELLVGSDDAAHPLDERWLAGRGCSHGGQRSRSPLAVNRREPTRSMRRVALNPRPPHPPHPPDPNDASPSGNATTGT